MKTNQDGDSATASDPSAAGKQLAANQKREAQEWVTLKSLDLDE